MKATEVVEITQKNGHYLITYRKSYMSFQLVSKSVTLNDLEQRNGRFLRYFSDFGSFHCTLHKSG